jgi:Helix-turn-helix domain
MCPPALLGSVWSRRRCTPDHRRPGGECTLRKLADARHAPASWLQRARIITGGWDGAAHLARERAAELGCHPIMVYRWLHRFNQGGIDDSATCSARVGPAAV